MSITALQTCRCTSSNHGHAIPCPQAVTESDGQCKLCHDRAAEEWGQTSGAVKLSNLVTVFPMSNVANVIGVDFARSGGMFSYPNQEKVRSLEDEIRGLRDNLKKLAHNLQEEKTNTAEHKHRVEELTATLDKLTKKEQLAFLLGNVSPKAADVLLVSESLRAQFLNSDDACPLYAMSVDIRRSTDLMLKARTPQEFAAFITNLCKDLSDVVRKFHGVVDKFTGDGILCFFPEFFSGPDAGYYALAAADECHSTFDRHLPCTSRLVSVGS